MPAPKTSTLRMPTVDSSHATLTASSTLVDTIAAKRSATPTTVSGTSQSTGLR